MSDFLRSIGRALAPSALDTSDPQEFDIAGRVVRCSHCGGTRFGRGIATLHKTTSNPLALVAQTATILVCSECGHIEWFLKAPERR